jgi:hypothetical protein
MVFGSKPNFSSTAVFVAEFLRKNSGLAGGPDRIRTRGPVGKICL